NGAVSTKASRIALTLADAGAAAASGRDDLELAAPVDRFAHFEVDAFGADRQAGGDRERGGGGAHLWGHAGPRGVHADAGEADPGLDLEEATAGVADVEAVFRHRLQHRLLPGRVGQGFD